MIYTVIFTGVFFSDTFSHNEFHQLKNVPGSGKVQIELEENRSEVKEIFPLTKDNTKEKTKT